MPLKTNCPGCGKLLEVPDAAIGKRAKCPACSHVWQIARPVVDAEPLAEIPKNENLFDEMMADDYPLADVARGGQRAAAQSTSQAEPPRRPCPQCGEMIPVGAAMCRFCDAIFDEGLRKSVKKKKKSYVTSDDDDLTAGDWVLCILCTNIACILGIVYLITGKPKAGKMIGIAILFQIIWAVIAIAFQAANQPQGFQ